MPQSTPKSYLGIVSKKKKNGTITRCLTKKLQRKKYQIKVKIKTEQDQKKLEKLQREHSGLIGYENYIKT